MSDVRFSIVRPQSLSTTNRASVHLSIISLAGNWLQSRRYLRHPSNHERPMRTCGLLALFFANKRLDQFTISDVFEYHAWRKQNIRRPEVCQPEFPGHNTINREIEVLRSILKSADLWDSIGKHYKSLPETKNSPGQALTPAEMTRLFEICASSPRWDVALQCVVISACTTCGPGEVCHLRLCDIYVDAPVPHIVIRRGAKNKFRLRELALNDLALAAIKKLMKRATSKGCVLPEHYLLPHRAAKLSDVVDPRPYGGNFNPLRPQGGYKTAWIQIRKAFAKEFPERAKFRLYDLRHSAVTVRCYPTLIHLRKSFRRLLATQQEPCWRDIVTNGPNCVWQRCSDWARPFSRPKRPLVRHHRKQFPLCRTSRERSDLGFAALKRYEKIMDNSFRVARNYYLHKPEVHRKSDLCSVVPLTQYIV